MLPKFLSSMKRKAGTAISLSLLGIGAAQAADVIKIASIAPNGSLYHRVLQEIGEAYRISQGPRARAIVYADSLQGTEADTVRRMRVGQLDGSMLSIVGLSQIDASVAALQFMPLMFRSWDEVDHVREQLRPELEAKLAARGFVVLMWGEAGWVQFFTREPITRPAQFKRTRIWAWGGHPAQVDRRRQRPRAHGPRQGRRQAPPRRLRPPLLRSRRRRLARLLLLASTRSGPAPMPRLRRGHPPSYRSAPIHRRLRPDLHHLGSPMETDYSTLAAFLEAGGPFGMVAVLAVAYWKVSEKKDAALRELYERVAEISTAQTLAINKVEAALVALKEAITELRRER